MLNDVRAVAFDLDNTLWEIEPVLERAEQRLLEWLHVHCPRIPASLSREDMRAARERLARSEPHNAHDFTYLRLTTLTRHVLEFGYDERLAQQAFEVFFTARNEVSPFGDVRGALERLRSRYELATLSNGNADLTRIGLADLFRVSLNARQVGVGKPHRRCFEELALRLALEPESIVYVGDDPYLDVDAARAAGLRTVWMNRRGELWPAELAGADLVVNDCDQLAATLGT